MDAVHDGPSRGAGAVERAKLMYRRIPVAPMALSVDGIDAIIEAPLDLGAALGELLVVELDSGERWVVQLRDLAIVEREAAEIDLAGDDELGPIRVRPLRRTLRGEAAILGRLDGGFTPGTGPVFGESPLRRATAEETRAVFGAGGSAGATGLALGDVLGQDGVAAPLVAKGFARHTFLCGQSGSGKTYTTGVLLEELLTGTDLPIVVLDPNSDYVRIAELAGEVDPAVGEHYVGRASDLIVARGRGAGGELLASHVSDLPLGVQAGMLDLDPIDDLGDFAALRRLTASLSALFSAAELTEAAEADGTDAGLRLAQRLRNLDVPDWGLWCREGEGSLVHTGVVDHRGVIIDLGSVATPREVALASLVVLQVLWNRRHERRPRLIVIDEAHNLFPTDAHDAVGRALVELGVRIAGEGRKFGLHLLLCTQRPAKLHPNVLSQCDNLVMLRVNSRTDVDELAAVFSHVPEGMIRRAPSLRQGEVLVAGPIAPIPRYLRTRRRLSAEGGADVSTSWATLADQAANPITLT
ncbi:MAG: ATP-binding protein [Actinomycetota bacterium]|nr:ATP-binding protein [Actinomycetota bacterium]